MQNIRMETRKAVKEIAESKGWELLECNPDNFFTGFCMVYNPVKNEFVTYMFNRTDKAFYSGHYFTSESDARQDFYSRTF